MALFTVAGLTISATFVHATEPSKQMSNFLTWGGEIQRGFINNAIIMVGVVASQTEPKIAKCIDTWYLADDQNKTMRQSEILSVMKKNSQYNPEAVILAVIEGACGQFERKTL